MRNHPARWHSRRWRKLRRTVFERDGHRCVQCGKAGLLELDHVRPVEKGGHPWSEANLQTLCRGCHIAKTHVEAERHPSPERDEWTARVNALIGA